MKKSLSVLIVITMLLSLFAWVNTFADSGVVFSESFESGMGDFTYASSKTTENDVINTSDKASDGKKSMHIIDKSDEAAHGVASPKVAAISNATYTLSVDMFSVGNKGVKVYLRFTDSKGTKLYNKGFDVTKENTWETVTVTETAPSNTAFVQVFVMSAGAGSAEAYVDNIRLLVSGNSGSVKVEDDITVSGSFYMSEDSLIDESFELGFGTFKHATSKGTDQDVINTMDKASHGNKSMHIIDKSEESAFGVASPKVAITSGKTYTMKVDMFAVGNKGVVAYLRFTDNKGTKLYNKGFKVTKENVWETIAVTEKAPETAEFAEIFVMSSGAGLAEAYVDRITLYEEKSGAQGSDANIGTGTGPIGGISSGSSSSGGGLSKETKLDKINKSSIILFIGSPNALVNGKKTFIDPENDKVIADTVNDRTLVPVRFIAENYGVEVGWDDPTKTVTLKMKDKLVTIVLDKSEIDINGKKITIDVPAKTYQDRTMLPLRAFVENVMDKKIFWDDRGLIVITDENILDADKDKTTIDAIINNIK